MVINVGYQLLGVANSKTIMDEVIMEVSTDMPEMDPNLWSSLTEELIEKIVARLPLKSLLQSKLLSRKWLSLHSTYPFQTEVSSVSSRWGSYYPLRVNHQGLIGYDRTCSRWQELFAIREISQVLCNVIGSLIVFSYYSDCILYVSVSNPIIQSIRRLPPLDVMDCAPLDGPKFVAGLGIWYDTIFVLPVCHHSYKVLLFSRNEATNVLQVTVYHGDFNVWSKPQSGPVLPGDIFGRVLNSTAYLGNIVYLTFLKSIDEIPCTLRSCLEDSMLFCAYDADDGVFKQIILPSPQQVPHVQIRTCRLVACRSELLLVVEQRSGDQDEEQKLEWIRAHVENTTGPEVEDSESDRDRYEHYLYIPKDSFLVFRLDMKTLLLSEISRGPVEKLRSKSFTGNVVTDRDCIYLETKSNLNRHESGAVIYDMRQQVWSYLPLDFDDHGLYHDMTEFSFDPGMDPFVRV